MSDTGARRAIGKMVPGSRTGGYPAAQPVDPTKPAYSIQRPPTPGGCYALIDKQTSDGTTDAFDFQDIPDSYSDLRVRIMGAIDIGIGGVGTCYLQLNGDATESYRALHVNWLDNLTTISQVDPDIGFDLPGPTFSGATFAAAAGVVDAYIYEYTTEAFWKNMEALGHEFSTNGDGTLDTARASFRSSQWMNTDVVTSVQVGTVTALGGGGGGEVFLAGTTCTLHGIC